MDGIIILFIVDKPWILDDPGVGLMFIHCKDPSGKRPKEISSIWALKNNVSIIDTPSGLVKAINSPLPEILKFVLVSPPVGKYDFNFLAPCPASGVVIHADKDSLVEVNLIKDVVKRLNQQKTIHVKHEMIKSSDHFFNNNENKVIEKVKKYYISEQN